MPHIQLAVVFLCAVLLPVPVKALSRPKSKSKSLHENFSFSQLVL